MSRTSHTGRRNSWPFSLFGKRKRKGVAVHVHDEAKLGRELQSPVPTAGPGCSSSSGIYNNPTAVFLCQQGKPETRKVGDNETAPPPPPPPPRRTASKGPGEGATSAIIKPHAASQSQQQVKVRQTKVVAAAAEGAHPRESVDPVFCTIRPPKVPSGGGGGGGGVGWEKGGGGGGGYLNGGYLNGQMLQLGGGGKGSVGEQQQREQQSQQLAGERKVSSNNNNR